MKRIREDRARVSPQLKPLIDYIADHLFDIDFQVTTMLAECGVRAHTIPTKFAAQLGHTPRDYVSDCRLEVAARMLRSSDLHVWRIGTSVGYDGDHPFSRAFKRRYGMGPRDYRLAAQVEVPTESSQAQELITAAELVEALAGKLEPADAESLEYRLRAIGDRLRILYPNLRQTEVPVRPVAGAEFVEQVMAELLWERIRSKPWNDQRTLVKSQFCFSTPALFDLLLRKCREEGREDRSRGVLVAQLALDSLDSIAGSLMEFLPSYRAKGMAYLSAMYRLELDLNAAEKSLDYAEIEWQTPEEDSRDQAVLHLIVQNRASLRLYQRRFEEAYELITRATGDLAESCTCGVLMDSLIIRGVIESYARTPVDTIASLRKALELVDEHTDRYLRLCLLHNLARAYVEADWHEAAGEYISLAKNLAEQCNHQQMRYLILGVEGKRAAASGDLVAAERCLSASLSGLCALMNSDDAAYFALELAIIYFKQGRPSEVLEMAVKAIKLLEPLGIHEEVAVAYGLLRDAVKGTTVPLEILEQCKEHIERYLKDPTKGIKGIY